MKSLIASFLDIMFPEQCLGCKSKGTILCKECLLKIRRAERETSRDIFACFDYRDPTIKRAIWNLKYYHKKHLGEILGHLLYQALLEEIASMKIYAGERPLLVIPVPLSRTRRKMRGYNQAQYITYGFCKDADKKSLELSTTIIVKKVDTVPQARITNRTTRLKNIHGAFEIKNPSIVKGRTIIIIDDVTTTGGTITEIMQLLKKSGAKKVVGFAVAH